MNTHPEVVATPDYPVVKIREPREKVDLDKVLQSVMSIQGWGVGTYFHVQFISHDRAKLLSAATFVVTEAVETLQTSDASPHQTITRAVTLRQCAQIGEWWPKVALPLSAAAAPACQEAVAPTETVEALSNLEGQEVTIATDSAPKPRKTKAA